MKSRISAAVRKGRPSRGGGLPQSLQRVANGGVPQKPLPRFPVDVMRLPPSELDPAQPHVGNLEWWDKPFEMGRRPFDTSARPTWRALFEPLLPLEGLLGPTYGLWLRARGVVLGALLEELAASVLA